MSEPTSPRTRRVRAIGPAVAVVLALVATTAAQAQTSDDLQRELDGAGSDAEALSDELATREQRVAAAEEELAVVGADLEDARGRLRAAEGQLALAEAALAEAEDERDVAIRTAEAAERSLARTDRELRAQEETLADQAVAAYKRGSVGQRAGTAAVEVLAGASDPGDLAVGMHRIGRVLDDQNTTVDEVTALRDERASKAREAERARGQAAQAAADASDQVAFTESLREDAATLTADIERQEAEQEAVLTRLRVEAAETEEALQRVASRQQALTAELAARRAAEQTPPPAARGGSASGSAGGPAIDGVCPVVGAVAGRDFSNDWGVPRSGGRTHQGNDIFAARGTPIVAIAAGTVVRVNATESGLGGLTVTYRTGDGSEWYNAHLDTVAVSVGQSVAQGETVGTVGNTGNARTTPPHNHIGRRVNGGWVNPWPTISPLCR